MQKAVITGDIVNSRKVPASSWIKLLKCALGRFGKEPADWEIFRGDSFQLSVKPQDGLIAAYYLKSVIKSTGELDIRVSIGIGEETYRAAKITESNGSAYVRSGEAFETLRKGMISVDSDNEDFNEVHNLLLDLAMLTANRWSTTVAEAIQMAIENPEKSQKELAGILGKSQSSVSEALKRGGYDELMALNAYFQKSTARL